MKLGQTVKSVSFGIVLGLLVIGLLPFLVVFSFAELYGSTEIYEWYKLGEFPFFIFPMKKRKP